MNKKLTVRIQLIGIFIASLNPSKYTNDHRMVAINAVTTTNKKNCKKNKILIN